MNLPLDPHQVETVEFGMKNPYSIFALEMGLGKSACALAIWERTRTNMLVVCPSYLILNWVLEIRKWLGDSVIVTAIKKGGDIYPLVDTDIAIISFDLAQKAEHLFENWAETVIIDEGQNLKSMKAKRTEFLHRVIYENSIPRLHILTGTPIDNRVEEYYSLLALCNYDPRFDDSGFLSRFESSVDFADYFSFRKEFTMEINGRYFTVCKWEGLRNKEELWKYIRPHYISYKSDQVLNLGKTRYKDILISETPDKDLLAAFDSHFADEENESISSTKKAEAALKKVPFTIQYVKEILEEIECVPIYTDHTESAFALAEAFGVPAITGATSKEKRHRLAQEFQAGKSRVIVATMRSFSTGVNLDRANNLVINDPPWVPGVLQQTIFRIKRRTQTRPCTVHRILGSPQDAYIYNVLEDKTEVINQIT